MADRLGTDGQNGVDVERLARLGHQLARHLELEPLLEQAVEMFGALAGAEQTCLVTIEGDQAQLRAHRGLTGMDLTGWPRPVSALHHWEPGAASPDARSSPMCPISARAELHSVPSPSPGPASATMTPQSLTTLRVPVSRDGVLAAVLYAARPWHRPFPAQSAKLAAIFAEYLSVAMVNADLYRTLQRRATHDPLTGLANRVLVSQHLDQVLADGQPGRVGLLFCDLDRFKAVNDLLGHEAGDDLLQQVAERLRGALRPDDLLARFGGDEFLVVLGGVRNLTEVADVGRRVAGTLDREFVLRGSARVRVSASVGGVLGVPGRSSSSDMMRNADAALYVAKERGLGKVEVFDDDASHRSLDRLDLRAEVHHAIERDQLQVRYQPIVRLDDGKVVAFEAKLRWHHPRHGLVPGEMVVSLAEDTGTIGAIGGWLLDRACQQLAAWRQLPGGGEVALGVDLSADQLGSPEAALKLLEVIKSAGLEPASVWFEVTQHRFRCNELLKQANWMREAGVRFALDGFGTDYSNLRFLRSFPVEILKIDLEMVSEVACWAQDPSLVRAILAIADSLRLTPIGEGLQPSNEHATLLHELGCELGQGHLPAMAAEEATALLRTSAAA